MLIFFIGRRAYSRSKSNFPIMDKQNLGFIKICDSGRYERLVSTDNVETNKGFIKNRNVNGSAKPVKSKFLKRIEEL